MIVKADSIASEGLAAVVVSSRLAKKGSRNLWLISFSGHRIIRMVSLWSSSFPSFSRRRSPQNYHKTRYPVPQELQRSFIQRIWFEWRDDQVVLILKKKVKFQVNSCLRHICLVRVHADHVVELMLRGSQQDRSLDPSVSKVFNGKYLAFQTDQCKRIMTSRRTPVVP